MGSLTVGQDVPSAEQVKRKQDFHKGLGKNAKGRELEMELELQLTRIVESAMRLKHGINPDVKKDPSRVLAGEEATDRFNKAQQQKADLDKYAKHKRKAMV